MKYKAIQFGLPGIQPDELKGEGFSKRHGMRAPGNPMPEWLARDYWLNGSQSSFLAHLYENPGLTVAQVASKAGCKEGSARQIVSQLHTAFRHSTTAGMLWEVRSLIEGRDRKAG